MSAHTSATGCRWVRHRSTLLPSYFDDLGEAYFYYEKTAAADAQAQNTRYYGWDNYARTPITWIKRVPAVDFGTQPSPAYINAVNTTSNGVFRRYWRPLVGKPPMTTFG